jgi:hypothetical protein
MNTWKKEDGTEVECNDNKETNAYCESRGWKCIDRTEPEGKKLMEEPIPGDVKPGTPDEPAGQPVKGTGKGKGPKDTKAAE